MQIRDSLVFRMGISLTSSESKKKPNKKRVLEFRRHLISYGAYEHQLQYLHINYVLKSSTIWDKHQAVFSKSTEVSDENVAFTFKLEA
jgi:hypothetical protein